MSIKCSGPTATAICIINGYDRCDMSTGNCVNDDPEGMSTIKDTSGRLKNRIDNQRTGRLPGFDNSQPQSQPYRVSMTASSPSIGPAAGVIGFDGSVYNDRYSNFTRGYFEALFMIAGLGILGIVGLFKAGQGKPNLLKFTGGAAVGFFGAGYISKNQMRKNYRVR